MQYLKKMLLALILLFSFLNARLAFPGAAGPGQYTSGGRGGSVLKVTNLEDNRKKGSLRWAINQDGPRTIIFEISGTIDLDSVLRITNRDLTIAGQTAPGDGICIKGYTTDIEASNVIIRYIRFRMGDINKYEGDALSSTDGNDENIMIDHCSFSWSIDEVLSIYDNKNVTVQWSMITESLNNSYHHKGPHGYGGIWGGRKAAFHHNLLAHQTSRNPRFQGARDVSTPKNEIVDYRNNVIYNWGHKSIYAGEEGNYNIVANYFKYGPATKIKTMIAEPWKPAGEWYVNNNFVFGFPRITKNNWNGGIEGRVRKKCRVKKAHNIDHAPTHQPQNAYQLVLANAGAVLPKRDPIDTRIVQEVMRQTATYGKNGIINSQSEVGGWPKLRPESSPPDSDGDGMPDSWEKNHNLNPNDPNDKNDDSNGNGYTNLEEYLNNLTKREAYIGSPAQLKAKSISSSAIQLNWKENVAFEKGFKIERAENNDDFIVIGQVEKNSTSYIDHNVEPEAVYHYRVRAFHESATSIPSNPVRIKTILKSRGE